MKPIRILLICLLAQSAFSQSENEKLLDQLDLEITKRNEYDEYKRVRIDKLTRAYREASGRRKFDACTAVYNEYKTFIYDSAFLYGTRLLTIASQLDNRLLVTSAKIKLSFVLVSSGLFNEALDTLKTIRSEDLPDSMKISYFDLMARTCYDLADFSRDTYYGDEYSLRAAKYIDSAMVYLDENDVAYYLFTGLKSLHLRDMKASRIAYETMISKFNLTAQQYAVAASTLSFIYYFSEKEELAKEIMIKAAIADIQSSTKETVAMMKLAEMLFTEGDVQNAYRYIKIASEDAEFYGARQRKVQVAAIYPVIEGKHLNAVESKRKMLLAYASLITLLALSVVGFSAVIYKQNKKLQKARRIISQANESLTEANHQLQDANKIKEEYIWYYFNTTAEHITKLDSLKKTLDLKLMTKRLEDIRFAVDSINIKREREELYHNFDRVFLKLFPDFVTIFNSLFKEEDRVVLKEGQLLNTELRIFALIRMGVHDHEKIAKILDYSVTTIYTYKTRLRNKSLVSSDQFDKIIMSIRAI